MNINIHIIQHTLMVINMIIDLLYDLYEHYQIQLDLVIYYLSYNSMQHFVYLIVQLLLIHYNIHVLFLNQTIFLNICINFISSYKVNIKLIKNI